MRQDKTSRRTVLKAIGATGTAASLAGCVGGVLGGSSKIQKAKKDVKAALGKYDGPKGMKKARKEGYIGVMGPFFPSIGWHLLNKKYVGKAVKRGGFKLEEPQILIYDADRKLGAVEWGAPAARMGNPSLFSDIDQATWAPHQQASHVLSDGDGKVKPIPKWSLDELLTDSYWTELRPPKPNLKPGDKIKAAWGFLPGAEQAESEERVVDYATMHPTLTSLHLWAFKDNPNGPFSANNPSFAQQEPK